MLFLFYTFEINLNDKGGGLAKYSNRAPSSRGPEQQLALRLLLLLLLLDPPPVLLLLLLVAPGVTLFLFSVAAVVAVGFLVRRVLPAPHLELDLLLLLRRAARPPPRLPLLLLPLPPPPLARAAPQSVPLGRRHRRNQVAPTPLVVRVGKLPPPILQMGIPSPVGRLVGRQRPRGLPELRAQQRGQAEEHEEVRDEEGRDPEGGLDRGGGGGRVAREAGERGGRVARRCCCGRRCCSSSDSRRRALRRARR